jgi:LMBR1 domain-containing protein 1
MARRTLQNLFAYSVCLLPSAPVLPSRWIKPTVSAPLFCSPISLFARLFAYPSVCPFHSADAGMTGCKTYRSAYCGFLGDLSSLWQIIAISIAVFALIIIPFTVFYYESYDMTFDTKTGRENETSCFAQACQALKWTFVSLFVGLIVFFIGFMFLRKIRIPIMSVQVSATDADSWANYNYGGFTQITNANKQFSEFSSSEITMDATIAVWLIAFVCFIGWIFFLLYASIGLAALPTDLYIDFKRRPTLMKPVSYSKRKKETADRAEMLKKIAQDLKTEFNKMDASEKKKSKRERQKAAIRLQQSTLLLERDWEGVSCCFFSPLYFVVTHLSRLSRDIG